ncbi:MAG TPA: hypothetical protein VK717_01810 [Opitutaceae bacterium]|jgi:hypothetical protein|nr:hypothetical protein [Opitutaceae bacterium]
MSALEELTKSPIKKTPDVWVKRLLILSKLTPQPVVIRDIPLRQGLNIVWAEEPESDTDTSDVAGHSAGKTTFCRLLRYVLGEKTFANKTNTQAIKKSFPNGYVAAEISLKGVVWAVLRPLGENRNSYILKDATIEGLYEKKGEAAYQDTYPKQLGLENLLDELASSTVVRTNEEIKWGHLLAWCARDQEARFQNVYDWRSPRSESEWPAFRFPKADPLFVMRIALGLFLPDELKAEENLADQIRAVEKAEGDLERSRREPDYWHQYYDTRLRQQLKAHLPSDQTEIDKALVASEELTFDLKRFVEKAKYLLEEATGKLEGQQAEIQEQLNALNENLADSRNELSQLKTLFQLGSKAGEEISAGLKRNEEFRSSVIENKDKRCPYGDVLIGQCSYVQNRQATLKGSEVKETHALEQMEAARENERNKITDQQSALERSIRESEQKRATLTKQQTNFSTEIREKKVISDSLNADLAEVVTWKSRVEAPEKYAKLTSAVESIAKQKADIETQTLDLNVLLTQHDANRALLSSLFSAAAKKVLPSSSYDGKVTFADRELNFQVTHGGAMTGEAMETLAVLLADISCLVFNSLSKDSLLPGFLLHDSPREADLGLRLYHSYIRFAAWLDEHFQKIGGCPFQYILTTTTSPPKALQKKDIIVLRLDASKEDELLFRRNLSRPPESEQLEMIPTS